ncbi:alpha-L-rhamnosidase N-terminal domain-containing protein, partial [Enterococcus faecalis]
MEEHEHVADFVGPSWSESETDHRHLPLVRTEVELNEQPKRARLYLSALGLVEAEINGVKVGNDA